MNNPNCRFENTYKALYDCYHHYKDDAQGTEQGFKKYLLELCKIFIDKYSEDSTNIPASKVFPKH